MESISIPNYTIYHWVWGLLILYVYIMWTIIDFLQLYPISDLKSCCTLIFWRNAGRSVQLSAKRQRVNTFTFAGHDPSTRFERGEHIQTALASTHWSWRANTSLNTQTNGRIQDNWNTLKGSASFIFNIWQWWCCCFCWLNYFILNVCLNYLTPESWGWLNYLIPD